MPPAPSQHCRFVIEADKLARICLLMRVTLQAIHDELQRLGHDFHLETGDGYFYFGGGEANDWLDKTVRVPTLSSLTLEQWATEFNRLKKLNEELSGGKAKATPTRPKKS